MVYRVSGSTGPERCTSTTAVRVPPPESNAAVRVTPMINVLSELLMGYKKHLPPLVSCFLDFRTAHTGGEYRCDANNNTTGREADLACKNLGRLRRPGPHRIYINGWLCSGRSRRHHAGRDQQHQQNLQQSFERNGQRRKLGSDWSASAYCPPGPRAGPVSSGKSWLFSWQMYSKSSVPGISVALPTVVNGFTYAPGSSIVTSIDRCPRSVRV